MHLIPFPHHLTIGNMAPYLPSTAARLVSDQTRFGTTRSQGGNTILLLQKHTIFVVWVLQRQQLCQELQFLHRK